MNKKERKRYNKENKKAIKKIQKNYTPEEIADSFILPAKVLSKKKEDKKIKKMTKSLRYVRILNRLVTIDDKLAHIEKQLLPNN